MKLKMISIRLIVAASDAFFTLAAIHLCGRRVTIARTIAPVRAGRNGRNISRQSMTMHIVIKKRVRFLQLGPLPGWCNKCAASIFVFSLVCDGIECHIFNRFV